jgi:hypothetical protein
MHADSFSQQLSKLRATADSSLRSYLRQAAFPVAVRDQAADPDGRTASGRPQPPGAVPMNARLRGKTILLDDERTLRALAKEIKLLITEDKRRGLGV